jgi:hypothetical protein
MNKTITKRQSKNKELLVKYFSEMPIVTISCKKANISRGTYYKWYHEDSEFAQQVDKARLNGVSLINDLAESTVVSLIKDERNLGACAFWLKHNCETYSPKIEISTTNNKNPLSEEDTNNLTDLFYDPKTFKEGQKLLTYYVSSGKITERLAQIILKTMLSQLKVEDVVTRKKEVDIMSEVMIRGFKIKQEEKLHHGSK